MENKERALNLLIETYKLYAGFSAIIIAGLLSYSSGNISIAHDNLLYVSILILCLSSLFCIFGIQYFISRVNKGNYDIYSGNARLLTIVIMITLFLGLLFSFLYIYNYKNNEKSNFKSEKTSMTIQKRKIDEYNHRTYDLSNFSQEKQDCKKQCTTPYKINCLTTQL